MTCGVEKFWLVDQNGLERDFSALLPRILAVGRRQHAESIEVALDMEQGGLMDRLTLVGATNCKISHNLSSLRVTLRWR